MGTTSDSRARGMSDIGGNAARSDVRLEALRMASEDSGVTEINRLFKAINKPKIDGELIRYFRKAKRDSVRSPSRKNGG